MPNQLLSVLTLPVDVGGEIQNITYDIKDAYARQRIAELGSAVYWMGVTTTTLSDGSTTNPITINGDSVTAETGGMAQYDGVEYVWSGSAWQEMGHGNFGSLAFKSSASGSFTPQGTINITPGTDTTTTVNSITAVGTLPKFTQSGETLVFSAGTLPTKGADTTVVTASGSVTATFSGTAGSVTVS